MIAIDTNVLVRLLVRDDDVQARRAVALFEQNEIYVCKTVLLETEWVLRFGYELDGAAILDALHLASSGETAQFATFDKRLKKRADTAAPGRHVVEA